MKLLSAILRLDKNRSLKLKIKLEAEDTHGKYILYTPYAEPVSEDDWLLFAFMSSSFISADPIHVISHLI